MTGHRVKLCIGETEVLYHNQNIEIQTGCDFDLNRCLRSQKPLTADAPPPHVVARGPRFLIHRGASHDDNKATVEASTSDSMIVDDHGPPPSLAVVSSPNSSSMPMSFRSKSPKNAIPRSIHDRIKGLQRIFIDYQKMFDKKICFIDVRKHPNGQPGDFKLEYFDACEIRFQYHMDSMRLLQFLQMLHRIWSKQRNNVMSIWNLEVTLLPDPLNFKITDRKVFSNFDLNRASIHMPFCNMTPPTVLHEILTQKHLEEVTLFLLDKKNPSPWYPLFMPILSESKIEISNLRITIIYLGAPSAPWKINKHMIPQFRTKYLRYDLRELGELSKENLTEEMEPLLEWTSNEMACTVLIRALIQGGSIVEFSLVQGKKTERIYTETPDPFRDIDELLTVDA